MDFEFTPGQQLFREDVRQFALREIAPHVRAWDEAEELSPDIMRKLAERGYLGSIFPREYGGLGLGYVEYCLLVEELSRVDPSVGLLVASHTSLCTNHVYKFSNEEQRRRYLRPLASGEMIGCWSFTEPDAGSDAAGMKTVARLEGDTWVINGHKRFTTNAMHARLAVVIAVTDPDKPKHGISAFIVETNTPGFRLGDRVQTLGMKGVATSNVTYDGCRIPKPNLLGVRGEGFVDCLKVLDGGRISIAALGVGIAQGAFDVARAYATKRKQFGQMIADFQAIQHKLVDMHVGIEAARLLMLKAARACDEGRRFSKESAIAKLYTSEVAVKVADEAVQILSTLR